MAAFSPNRENQSEQWRDYRDAALSELRSTSRGGRNIALNTAAFRLGRLVGGGFITSTEATAALESVASDIGLKRVEYRATIRGGLAAGAASPWREGHGERLHHHGYVTPTIQTPANDDDKREANRIKRARDLWARTVPLIGTDAETYLGEPPSPEWQIENFSVYSRCIPSEWIQRLEAADVARFLPHYQGRNGAVIFKAENAAGEIQAVQVIRLDIAGRDKAQDGTAKLTYGVLDCAVVRLPGDGDVIATEGPETGLSCWSATGRPVLVTLGKSNFKNVAPFVDPGARITIAADRDDESGDLDNTVMKAVEALQAQGYAVAVAMPPALPYSAKSDWNDVHQWLGLEAVAKALACCDAVSPCNDVNYNSVMLPGTRIAVGEALVPVVRPPGIHVDEARAMIADAVGSFAGGTVAHWRNSASWRAMAMTLGVKGQRIILRQADRDEANAKLIAAGLPPVKKGNLFFSVQPAPGVLTIRADVGVGKSHAIHDYCRRLIAENPNCKIVVAVPNKALSVEAAAAMALGAGITATTFHGRSEDNCDAYEDVKLTFTAIENVKSKACINLGGIEEHRCSYYNECQYQQQERVIRNCNVVFMSHTYLTHDRPEFLNSVDAIVIDETFFQSTVMKSAGESDDEVRNKPSITAAGLRSAKDWFGDRRFREVAQRFGVTGENDWVTAMGRLVRVVDDSAGYVNRATIDKCGLTADDVAALRRMLWSFKLGSEMYPGMPVKGRKSENGRVASHNQTVSKLSVVLEILARHFEDDEPLGIGELWAGTIDRDKDDGALHGLRILHCRPIHSGWRAPTMVLDASADMEFIAPFFDVRMDYSRIVYLDLPRCETPHQRVVQIIGAPTTANKMIRAGQKGEYLTTAKNNQRHIANAAKLIAGDGNVLFVGQKSAIDEMKEAELLPSHWHFAWFNNLVGRNAWKGVDYLFVVGRTAPNPREVEELASAVSRRPVERIPNGKWYPKVDGFYRHPDPTAEAIRRRICEGEIAQAIGRARGINRTAADPVLVIVMNNEDVAPDARAVWREPTRADVMSATGVILESPSDRTRCFRDLWKTPSAAKQDPVDGIHTVYNPYSGLLQEIQTVWSEVRYQHVGERQKLRRAWFRLDMIADPAAWLAEKLGPLARFEVLAPEVVSVAVPETERKPEPVALVVAPVQVGLGFFMDVGEEDPLSEM
jgi:putative DNA primase/helicase